MPGVRRKTVGTFAFLLVAGTSVGAVAAWNGFQSRSQDAEAAARAFGFAPPQWSNVSAKTDRLPLVKASFRLASADPADMPQEPAAAPLVPKSVPTIVSAPVEKPAAVAAPRAEEKSKPLPPPPARPSRTMPANALMDESQIASLKDRLRLSPDQAEYWPAVETALVDVVRQQAHEARNRRRSTPPRIDVNSAEVQRLIYAAMPLLMRLREDQKREVRQLARIIGLESVASQI